MHEADRQPHCPRCGYDLRGQTVERCPECGLHYDAKALESITREAFHRCIGPYLNSIWALTWSAAVSLAQIGSLLGPLLPCAFLVILPLALLAPAWIESRSTRGPEDRALVRRRWMALEILPSWPFVLGGIAVMHGALHLLVLPAAVSVASGLLLALGLWYLATGLMEHGEIERRNLHLSMPWRRARALEKLRTTCLIFAGAGGVLLVATVCLWSR